MGPDETTAVNGKGVTAAAGRRCKVQAGLRKERQGARRGGKSVARYFNCFSFRINEGQIPITFECSGYNCGCADGAARRTRGVARTSTW